MANELRVEAYNRVSTGLDYISITGIIIKIICVPNSAKEQTSHEPFKRFATSDRRASNGMPDWSFA
jgi:hypothetical protein